MMHNLDLKLLFLYLSTREKGIDRRRIGCMRSCAPGRRISSKGWINCAQGQARYREKRQDVKMIWRSILSISMYTIINRCTCILAHVHINILVYPRRKRMFEQQTIEIIQSKKDFRVKLTYGEKNDLHEICDRNICGFQQQIQNVFRKVQIEWSERVVSI